MAKIIKQWTRYPNMKEYILDNISVTERGCWEWPHGHRPGGYAEVMIQGRKRRVHRVSYEIFIGPVPDGKSVCHHCDNPKCVNPGHLYAGTALDNARDVLERGSPGCSQLRKKDAEEVRRLYKTGLSIKAVSLSLGISVGVIKNIIHSEDLDNSWSKSLCETSLSVSFDGATPG